MLCSKGNLREKNKLTALLSLSRERERHIQTISKVSLGFEGKLLFQTDGIMAWPLGDGWTLLDFLLHLKSFCTFKIQSLSFESHTPTSHSHPHSLRDEKTEERNSTTKMVIHRTRQESCVSHHTSPVFNTQTETHRVLETDVMTCHPDQCLTNPRILTT